MPIPAEIVIGIVAAALVFGLEYLREQVWHQEIVLWLICLLAVGCTLLVLWMRGGKRFMRAELFPILFFLSAAPWPPRVEQPIVRSLMRWVAGATTELLQWMGIEAQTSGAAIALHSGLVGISEACSGVRSLQAGIMFGLAMGEWFLLRPWRRVVLLVVAIALALVTNLARTFLLALQAEKNGIGSVDRIHDLIGSITMMSLIIAIWLIGRLLSPRAQLTISIDRIRERLQELVRSWTHETAAPLFRSFAAAVLIGVLGAHAVSALNEPRDTQTTPFFSAKINSLNHREQISGEVWNQLRPTSGEHVRRESADVPRGTADCYHFFWKPSPSNRFALIHRPDICMPGVGWTSVGSAEPIRITVDGHSLSCHLFRFKRGKTYALELWGTWRNGEPLPVDYNLDQVIGPSSSASLHFAGKRRSATEIVACTIIADTESPPPQIAVALVQSVFDYKRRE